MLESWLSQAQSAEFLQCRRARLPFAAPSLAALSASLFDWDGLDAALRQQPAPDLLVVRSNELLDLPAPRSAHEVRALFASGAGIVIRRAQARTATLQELARRFEQAFAAQVHIQLFVTPAQRQGFGWHYDCDDVIILQTLGVKTYYFRANTQSPELDPTAVPDFSLVKRETSPLLTCTLASGDALFLPRGMWHAARAVEDSLSISLGLSEERAAPSPSR